MAADWLTCVDENQKATNLTHNTALMSEIAKCRECEPHLPLGARPIARIASAQARILIIGQAPGTKVHASGIPWDDASGKRLRQWMGVEAEVFYDQTKIAILPMGLCYPGRAKGGDAPPRPECAPLWHPRALSALLNRQLTLLVGSYALARYLGEHRSATLSETVRDWQKHMESGFFPLVHPSPRNQIWLRANPWFESEIVPELAAQVARRVAT
jgi:uracil-DNA glycosylase